MKAKKILAGLMTFGAYFVDTEAATRVEIAAVTVKKLAEDNGWMCVSMRDDFKMIYGDNVRRRD